MDELISFHVSEPRRTLVGANVSGVPLQNPVPLRRMVLTPENFSVVDSISVEGLWTFCRTFDLFFENYEVVFLKIVNCNFH